MSSVLRTVKLCNIKKSYSTGFSKKHIFPHKNEPIINFSVRSLYITQERNKNFVGQLIDNLRQEYNKDKELQKSVTKFYEETKKLDESAPLQKAREKYKQILESDNSAFKKSFGDFKEKLSENIHEAQKSEFVKKSKDLGEGFSNYAGATAKSIGSAAKNIAASEPFQKIAHGVEAARETMDSDTVMARHQLYKPPSALRRRTPDQNLSAESIDADDSTTEVVMHKDSIWYETWVNFREKNPYFNKLIDLKARYEESDHLAVRMTRSFTDRFSSAFSGVFGNTDLSDVLTEIAKMDPSFDKESFVKECQYDVIPNILEALVRGDLEILKDWCYETAFNQLSFGLQQARKAGHLFENKIIDISDVDIPGGKLMDQGPVLILSFNAQQIFAIRDKAGKIIEGDPDEIMRVRHIWVLCRDQTCLDPKAAWRLLEIQYHSEKQWF